MKTPKYIYLSIFVICCVLIAAVILVQGINRSTQTKANDVVGEYTLKYEGMSETLTLKPNGTYNQSLLDKAGKTITNSGTWNLEHISLSPSVSLKNPIYMPQISSMPGIPVPTDNWNLEITNYFANNVLLTVNEDNGLYFEKTTSSKPLVAISKLGWQ